MSKIFYDLYDKICSPLNLWWAYKDAARGKRYTSAVASFEYDLEKNLVEIERELKDQAYQLGGYHNFRIDKPKRRLVNAAPFRDRVAHRALMNIIEPLFERQFIFDTILIFISSRKFVSPSRNCFASRGRIPPPSAVSAP
jgi:hypothetical protein